MGLAKTFAFTLRAITFGDFYTLCYSVEEREDINFPILKALKRQGLGLSDEELFSVYG